jgi:hypothetical protein
LYSNEIVPVLFFLFLIKTLSPIFSLTENSNACKFVSLNDLFDDFFILKIFTKFSACLTERFLSTIFLATNSALSKPTRIFA